MLYFLAALAGMVSYALIHSFVKRQQIQVEPYQALLLYHNERVEVFFHQKMILAKTHKVIDLRMPALQWRFQQRESVSCQDGLRLELTFSIHPFIEKTEQKILSLLEQVSPTDIQNKEFLQHLFLPSIQETIISCAKTEPAHKWQKDPSLLAAKISQKLRLPLSDLSTTKVSVTAVSLCAEEFYDRTIADELRGLEKIEQNRKALQKARDEYQTLMEMIENAEGAQKELMKKNIEQQRIRGELQKAIQILREDANRFQQEVQIQLDLLRSDLDVRINSFRAEVHKQVSQNGMTTPTQLDNEVARLRTRKRAETDLLKGDHERKAQAVQTRVDQLFRG